MVFLLDLVDVFMKCTGQPGFSRAGNVDARGFAVVILSQSLEMDKSLEDGATGKEAA
jgi:hypothetical protein